MARRGRPWRTEKAYWYGAKWEIVGDAGGLQEDTKEISLAIDGSGTPYVAYEKNNKVTVMKYVK